MSGLSEIARSTSKEINDFRRVLHENPEISWEEDESLEFVRKSVLKIEPVRGRKLIIHENYKGGLVVDLFFPQIDSSKKMRLFRADIDALRIKENEKNDPRSKVDGKMHACGHDLHTSMLFIALKVLSTEERIKPVQNLRFVFQRAEESIHPMGISGGESLVKESGILDNVKDAFALHMNASAQSGVFLACSGPFLGNVVTLKMEVEAGSGGHPCFPHLGGNALSAIMELYRVLEDTVQKKKNPLSVFSVVPMSCSAGKTGVMPPLATMTISVRNLMSTEERNSLFSIIKSTIQSRAKELGVGVILSFSKGYPTLKNDPELFHKSRKWFDEVGIETKIDEPCLAGEDFSFYVSSEKNVRGVMWCLGSSDHEERYGGHISGPLHTPDFNPDPSVFWKGVSYWLALAVNS